MESRSEKQKKQNLIFGGQQVYSDWKIIKTAWKDKVQTTKRNRANYSVLNENGRNQKSKWT